MWKTLLVDAAGKEAAVDHENLSGDKGGGVGRQIDGRADQFLRLAEASHGGAHQEFLAAIALVEQLLIEGGAEDSRSDAIDRDTPRAPLDGKRLGERGDGGLGGGVGGDLFERDKGSSARRC